MAEPLTLPSPGPNLRVETGAVQFQGDWPGIFIRGDEALGFAASLTAVLRGDADRITAHHVFGLCSLLITAHAAPVPRKQMELRLRDAEERFLNTLAERGQL